MRQYQEGYNDGVDDVLLYLMGYFAIAGELTEDDKERIIKSVSSLKKEEGFIMSKPANIWE